jgi:hypothetical protein
MCVSTVVVVNIYIPSGSSHAGVLPGEDLLRRAAFPLSIQSHPQGGLLPP